MEPQFTRAEYLADPCGVSSLPYWKAVSVRVPAGVRILHARALPDPAPEAADAVRYFRLIHPMKTLTRPAVPAGCTVTALTPEAAADHVRKCYPGSSITASELAAYETRPVYDGSLWLALTNPRGEIVASGIGELDRDLGEGILEWIQVSPERRRNGLGSFLVRELLWRMAESADFVTVSGKKDDPCRPEELYRSCGFVGEDLWYLIRKPVTCYHASQVPGIRMLEPRISNHGIPLVYFSYKRENVLVYLSNAVEKYCRETGFPHTGRWQKWGPYGFNQDGRLRLEEYYPDALEDTYRGVSGFIYSAVGVRDSGHAIRIPDAITSADPVEVTGCEFVPDAWEAILAAEQAGLITILRYRDMSPAMAEWNARTIRTEYETSDDPAYRHFLRGKFKDLLADAAPQRAAPPCLPIRRRS